METFFTSRSFPKANLHSHRPAICGAVFYYLWTRGELKSSVSLASSPRTATRQDRYELASVRFNSSIISQYPKLLRKGGVLLLWTRGELNPHLSNANAVFYRLTTSPTLVFYPKKPPDWWFFLCGPGGNWTLFLPMPWAHSTGELQAQQAISYLSHKLDATNRPCYHHLQVRTLKKEVISESRFFGVPGRANYGYHFW